MNIDKNNWYILEKELTEEQYRDVAGYLVENYEEGICKEKIRNVGQTGHPVSLFNKWDLVGVGSGKYSSEDLCEDSLAHPLTESGKGTQITYQQFLEHIKGEGNLNQDNDGWVEWANTDCNHTSSPINGHVTVEVELRDGWVKEDLAGNFNWYVNCSSPNNGDIVRYRVVKEPEQPSEPKPDQTDTTSLVLELKRTSELVKRFGEVTGADLYFGADGIITIEYDCVEYEIDFDKVSELEALDLVNAMTTLTDWFKKKIETGGNV